MGTEKLLQRRLRIATETQNVDFVGEIVLKISFLWQKLFVHGQLKSKMLKHFLWRNEKLFQHFWLPMNFIRQLGTHWTVLSKNTISQDEKSSQLKQLTVAGQNLRWSFHTPLSTRPILYTPLPPRWLLLGVGGWGVTQPHESWPKQTAWSYPT